MTNGSGDYVIAFSTAPESRVVPERHGGYTVGVLVQTNFGGILTIAGAPVGKELGRYYMKDDVENAADRGDGSIIIVVATDAPLDARNLERLASRTLSGLARTGSAMTNGSGDYVIAFSTAPESRVGAAGSLRRATALANDAMSPLFVAAAEATEEAIYNSLFRATAIEGRDGLLVDALPLKETVMILERHGVIARPE